MAAGGMGLKRGRVTTLGQGVNGRRENGKLQNRKYFEGEPSRTWLKCGLFYVMWV